jgi:Protein of unknown function (DUF1822)
MISSPSNTLIDLDPNRVNSAIALSQTLSNPLTRWQSHLALLALEGFTQWISDRATPICVDRTQARLLEPAGFGIPAAVNSVYANQFHVGLLVVDPDVEDEIEFPVSLMQNPAHFYVAVCVDEESNRVSFHSFLRGDRLTLVSDTEATCSIPVALFETDVEQLLWYLASLDVSAIALPSLTPTVAPHQWLIQPLMNAAQWVQTQMDELTWTLFSPAMVPAMRSSATVDLVSVLTEIERRGIRIPSATTSAYRTITLHQQALRLYVVTWAVESEWSLLAILEAARTPTLTTGIRLVIQENETLVIEEEITTESAYLVAQVIGSWTEKFTLTIEQVDPNSRALFDSLSLPPIAFEP